jgi:hypothetical protein
MFVSVVWGGQGVNIGKRFFANSGAAAVLRGLTFRRPKV